MKLLIISMGFIALILFSYFIFNSDLNKNKNESKDCLILKDYFNSLAQIGYGDNNYIYLTTKSDSSFLNQLKIETNLLKQEKSDFIKMLRFRNEKDYYLENDSSCIEKYRLILDSGIYNPEELNMIIFIHNKDSNILKVKKWDSGNKVVVNNQKIISKEQWEYFKSAIDGSYFWQLGSIDPNNSQPNKLFSLEGYKYLNKKEISADPLQIKYHIVKRGDPKEGSFKDACDYLISISK